MYATNSNEQLTGFRIGRRTTGGTAIQNPEKALPYNQEGFFSKGMNFPTRQSSNKAIDWFNEFAQIVGGINTIINDNTNQNQIQNLNTEKSDNEKKIWKLFLGISIIALITLTLIFLIKK